jgi:ADP-ribose pyrophosphatase YjhB (NUDIX family)
MIKFHSHFGIYGLIKNTESLLLIRKARGPYKGMYDLPGGSPQPNETNQETFIREVAEETGLKIQTFKKLTDDVITIYYNYFDNSQESILKHSSLIYFSDDYSGQLKIGSDGEDSDGAQWLKISEIEKIPCTPFVKKVKNYLKTI